MTRCQIRGTSNTFASSTRDSTVRAPAGHLASLPAPRGDLAPLKPLMSIDACPRELQPTTWGPVNRHVRHLFSPCSSRRHFVMNIFSSAVNHAPRANYIIMPLCPGKLYLFSKYCARSSFLSCVSHERGLGTVPMLGGKHLQSRQAQKQVIELWLAGLLPSHATSPWSLGTVLRSGPSHQRNTQVTELWRMPPHHGTWAAYARFGPISAKPR